MPGKTYRFFKRIVRKKINKASGKVYPSYYISLPSSLVSELHLKEGDTVAVYIRKYYPKQKKNG
ncbi:MAG: hypothetical protein DRO04_00955 [Candidatus Iainarchaeum archaeon]|uniref:Uncharacterized protein n=1 Tax=Candidatus Iainarchaeum sp. TaxID=3101447 RepID=A0A497JHV7_9ARCH|nr:MAG: hypothetical protein DRO04_00955 [Candidatus Diapherotrites archaeon]